MIKYHHLSMNLLDHGTSLMEKWSTMDWIMINDPFPAARPTPKAWPRACKITSNGKVSVVSWRLIQPGPRWSDLELDGGSWMVRWWKCKGMAQNDWSQKIMIIDGYGWFYQWLSNDLMVNSWLHAQWLMMAQPVLISRKSSHERKRIWRMSIDDLSKSWRRSLEVETHARGYQMEPPSLDMFRWCTWCILLHMAGLGGYWPSRNFIPRHSQSITMNFLWITSKYIIITNHWLTRN